MIQPLAVVGGSGGDDAPPPTQAGGTESWLIAGRVDRVWVK